MERITALLAEDEASLATIVKESLLTQNIDISIANNGNEAWILYQKAKFDIVILDVMMPEKDGFAVAKDIRLENKEIPIIMLTSKSQTADVVYGFKNGANDYLKKPFSLEELIVRIESLVGRKKLNSVNTIFELGNYVFYFNKQMLQNSTEVFSLTYMEAKLLKLLIENRNEIVSKSYILKTIWGHDTFFNGRSLDVFITKLRKKLSQDKNIKIINSRGHGFKIVF